jgi:two-component system chemotaxis response regulator CheY
MKTLIAEDDFVSSNLLHGILLPYGRCTIATNGVEALHAFVTALEEEKPYNLICLDIQMPEMDGQETLRQIRSVEERRGIPAKERARVIMITAAGDLQNVKEAWKSQCEAYLVKPIEKQRLLDRIAEMNGNNQGRPFP